MTNDTRLHDRLVPALLTSDMSRTLAFYELLGFHVTGSYPEDGDSTWAEIRRDGIVLQFHTEPPVGTHPSPVCSGTFYMFLGPVRALAEELRGRVEFAWGPEVMGYGLLELGVRDPDGYYLAFAEPVQEGFDDRRTH